MSQATTLLSISPYEQDHHLLARILAGLDVRLVTGATLAEARRRLSGDIAVIICERDLPDGTWKDLLETITSLAPTPPRLIVTSQFADEVFWSEVLNLGGFDVLLKPFYATEVCHVVSIAGQCRHNCENAQSLRFAASVRCA